jgi:hypothetical protein
LQKMESHSFEEINAEMDNPYIQHYISSLHGCLNTGEALLLDEEIGVTKDGLRLKAVTILQKQESPSSGFLTNFYIFLSQQNDISVPQLSITQKWMYTIYPYEEVLQMTYVHVCVVGRKACWGEIFYW